MDNDKIILNAKRFIYIDFLRGIAIFLVLFTHIPLDFSQNDFKLSIISKYSFISLKDLYLEGY